MVRSDGLVAVDVETDGTNEEKKDCRRATFKMAAVAPYGWVTYKIPTFSPDAEVIVHNIPYDPVVMGAEAKWHDTKMVAHLAGVADTSLKSMTSRFLHRPAMGYQEALASGVEEAYCLADAQNTFDLFPILLSMLRPETRRLYDELERPLMPLWSKMTADGAFFLKRDELFKYDQELTHTQAVQKSRTEELLPRGMERVRCQICGINKDMVQGRCYENKHHIWKGGEHWDSNYPTNINSPTQLLTSIATAFGVKLPSTDVESLQSALSGKLPNEARECFGSLLDYRHTAKELSTYILPWLGTPPGKRLGTIWRPLGTETGRISSEKPNLMNIPHHLERFFQAGDGYTNLEFDNGQLEVRVAAHISQDPTLLAACRSGDVHASMMEAFGLTDRKRAKIWVFGTMYLGGPPAIMREAMKSGIKMGWKEAENAQAAVHAAMPHYFGVWAPAQLDKTLVEGLFGRWHYIPEGDDAGATGRRAVNWPIQGGAGTITKWQMLAVWTAGYEIVRQVHDSLTVRVLTIDVPEARIEVRRLMEGACGLDVPIVVEEK